MEFGSQWLWNHHLLEDGLPQIHTYTAGAARPSDLDQPAVAAFLHATKPEETLTKLKVVVSRLDEAKEKALGKEWVENWAKGLPKAKESKFFVEHNQMIWIYNCIQAFGMYEFGKARYGSFEGNGKKWDNKRTPEENIDDIGKNGWGFVPGIDWKPDVDYSEDLVNVPAENLERVKEAEAFVHKWCASKKKEDDGPLAKQMKIIRRNFSVSRQMFSSFLNQKVEEEEKKETESKEEAESAEETIPKEWESAYDMRPWPDYPEQPSRA